MKLSKIGLAVLAAGLFASALTGQAAMINGAITFAGGAVFDTMSLSTATRVNTFSDVTVASRDGDFEASVTVGDSVTMASPYIFIMSTPTDGLWSVGDFTFDLDNSIVTLRNGQALFISGTGTIRGNGFDDTPGTFSFSSQSPDADGVFSFSSGSDAQGQGVPDGGTTVALLGFALAGIEIVRRKLATA